MIEEQMNTEKIDQLINVVVLLTQGYTTAFQTIATQMTQFAEYLQQAGELIISLDTRVKQLETQIQDHQTLENKISTLEAMVEIMMCGKTL